MATKKTMPARAKATKPTKKAGTDTAISVPIKKLNDRLSLEFKHELQETHIPALMTIAKDKELLEHYFRHRNLYTDMLGANIALLDRAMRSAFSAVAARDLREALFEKEDMTYPGIWTEFHLRSYAITLINVVTIEDKPEAGFFLSARRPVNGMPTEEETKTYGSASFMCYNAYDPTALYEFMMVIHHTMFGMVLREIELGVPAVLFSATGDPIAVRYGRQLGSLMNEPLKEEDDSSMTMAERAESFTKKLERPLIVQMSALLSEAGFAADAVNEMLSLSQASSTFTCTNKSGKAAKEFVHPWVKVIYVLTASDGISGQVARCTLCPADVYTAAKIFDRAETEENPETGEVRKVAPELTAEERNACNRVGKALLAFLDELSVYLINTFIFKENIRATAEVARHNTKVDELLAKEAAEHVMDDLVEEESAASEN